MKYVIDCSVGFKWFVVEPDRPKALRLRDDFTSGLCGLLAPDIFPTELGNALGLHMVSALADAGDGRNAMVVDFRQIFSLPVAYLRRHAASLGSRWRLQSPYGSISPKRSRVSSCASGCRRRFLPSNDRRAAYFGMTAKYANSTTRPRSLRSAQPTKQGVQHPQAQRCRPEAF
jgi:hypothetical protein